MTYKHILHHATPSLTALVFALSCYAPFAGAFRHDDAILGLTICVLAGIITTLLFRLGTRDVHKSLFFSSMVIFALTFNGDMRMIIRGAFAHIGQANSLPYRYEAGIAIGIVLLATSILALSKRTNFKRINQYLALTLVLIACTRLFEISQMFRNPGQSVLGFKKQNVRLSSRLGIKTTSPNVFFIVLDSHASSRTLKHLFDYDHSSTIQEFNKRQFLVVEDARSDYGATEYSLASILNMELLGKILPTNCINMHYQLKNAVRNAIVPSFFESIGYKVVNLSLFDIGTAKRLYTYDEFFPDSFCQLLWNKCLLGETLFRLKLATRTEETNLKILAGVEKSSRLTGPLFAYAHFFMPHHPYLFDRNGGKVPGFPPAYDKKAYLEQLLYSDSVVLRLIDNILANSKTPPIIIVQGDHGFRYFSGIEGEKERQDIFYAVYLPDRKYDAFKNMKTCVNSFRIILNSCFGQNIEMEHSSENLDWLLKPNTAGNMH